MAKGGIKGTEKDVASAGTAEPLVASNIYVSSCTLIMKVANTGNIFVGDEDVASSDNDGLAPGDAISIPIPAPGRFNLADIYIDSDVNGEGVNFWYVQA